MDTEKIKMQEDYMKAMAEMLKELNEELKEEKYNEQEMDKMCKYYEREGN